MNEIDLTNEYDRTGEKNETKREDNFDRFSNDPWAESEIVLPEENDRDSEPETDEYLAGLEALATKHVDKKNTIWQKVSILIVSAILFGGIAGGVFLGVQTLSEYMNDKKTEESNPVEGVSETDTLADSSGKKHELGNTETVINSNKSNEVSAIDVSAIVESVMPAVVAINCYEQNIVNNPFRGSSSSDGSLVLAGSGSGIIIGQNDTEVLIVTNNHVIDGAEKISIELVDGEVAEATVKGTAPSSDLAVLAIPFSGLQETTINNIRIARLGNSDEVKIGQMAIAIGNALGYGQSVTVGYISAKDREVSVDNVIYHLIQTDAAINPGNSGGALLNAQGEVIGINSVKYSNSSVEGMGFAIPITNIVELIQELSNREVLKEEEHGFLGISRGQDITSSYANLLGISQGVYVRQILPDSPAAKAGMYSGDIITQVDNTIISCMSDLQSFLSYTKAGTKVTVYVQRMEEGSYRQITLEVTLGSRPANTR